MSPKASIPAKHFSFRMIHYEPFYFLRFRWICYATYQTYYQEPVPNNPSTII